MDTEPRHLGDHLPRWLAAFGGLSLLVAAGTAWLGPAAGLRAVWYALNGALAVGGLVWGLVHARLLLQITDAVLRWIFWASFLIPLLALARVEESLAPTGQAVVVLVFPVFLAAFLGGVVVAWLGGAVGGLVGGRRTRPTTAARTGAVAMAALGFVVVVSEAGRPAQSPAGTLTPFWLSSLPFVTALVVLLASRVMPASGPFRQQLHRLLTRLLVHRVSDGIGTYDLRGAALGALAAGLALVLSGAGLLLPIQTRVLDGLLRTRATITASQPTALDARDAVIVTRFDRSSRRRALLERSEAGVQADVIRQIAAWRPLGVVLPQPAFEPRITVMDGGVARPAARSVEHLAELTAAVRESGRVVLGTEPSKGSAPGLRALAEASWGRGSLAPDWFASTRLPALDTEDTSEVPVATAAVAAVLRIPPTPQPGPRAGVKVIAAHEVPEIEPGRALPYFAGRTDDIFRTVEYDAILRGDPVYAGRRPDGMEVWIPPAQLFRGRFVVLDELDAPRLPTPVGELPRPELVAHTIAALLGRQFIERPSPAAIALATIVVALMVGQFSLGREPSRAGGLVAAVSLAVMAAAVGGLVAAGVWFDPILPLLAAALAALLVTQLTFTLEREEHERNRGLLERFVAPQVVDELLEDPERELGLGGRRRRICVLFADIRDSTSFAEQHTPEEVIEAVNRYLTALTEELYRHGGLLDKYTGDGLMAIFTVGEQTRDDVGRAVRCALDMQSAAMALSERLRAEGETPMGIGISVHYGEAVVGLVGNPHQFNYTALGYAVNVASRLQGLARANEVIVSEAVAEVVAETFALEALEPVSVRGVSDAVRPFHVVGERA